MSKESETPIKSVVPTVNESLERLENLFKSYQNDSEFNYQLNNADSPFNIIKSALEQLEEYKHADEKLGIDLITLIKALKNGIYGKVGNEIKYILAPHFSWYNREIYIFKLKDYGKTWALTREELENKQ